MPEPTTHHTARTDPAPAGAAELDAVLQALADSGVAIEAILDRFARLQPVGGRLARNGRPMPTVAEYLAQCRPG